MAIKYKTSVLVAKAHREDNDCSVKAVSIATDTPYIKAHTALAMAGRVNRQGAYTNQIKKAFEAVGFDMKPVLFTHKTVATIANDCDPSKSYVAIVRGHILAIRRGVVEDWTEGRRHHIQYLYEIVPHQSKNAKRKAARYGKES